MFEIDGKKQLSVVSTIALKLAIYKQINKGCRSANRMYLTQQARDTKKLGTNAKWHSSLPPFSIHYNVSRFERLRIITAVVAEVAKQPKKWSFVWGDKKKKRKSDTTQINGQSRVNIGLVFTHWPKFKMKRDFRPARLVITFRCSNQSDNANVSYWKFSW